MATYVPNASDATQPTGDKKVSSAAPEFRAAKTKLNLALLFPQLSEVQSIAPVATRANKLWAFGASGEFAYVDTPALPIPAVDAPLLSSIATLRLIDSTQNTRAFVLGYYTTGDGGGGVYWYDPTDTTTADNGGTVIVAADGARWKYVSTGAISVKVFGAVADGDGYGAGTNNSAAIQAAITYVVSTGKPGTIYVPTGIYRCDSGLVLDLSLCSIESDGATLDFTNMPGGTIADYTANGFNQPLVGVALTVTSSYGYAGGAYYEATQRVRGLRIKGKQGASEGSIPPAPPNDQAGVYFYGTTYTQNAALFENCVISQFYTGAIFGENQFGSFWLNSTFIFCSTCVYMPQVNNAGERQNFIGCTFYNSDIGLNLQNAFATTFVQGCSIGGLHTYYIYITKGHLTLDSNHFEGNFAPDYADAIILYNDDQDFPAYSVISLSGNQILAKTQRNQPVIKLDGAVMFTMTGGFIDGSTAGSAPVIGGAATSAGSMKIQGTWILNGSNTAIDSTMGLYSSATIDLADPVTHNTDRQGTYTPTLTNVTNITSTSLPWPIHYRKNGNSVDVWGAFLMDPSTVGLLARLGISLPLASDLANAADCSGDCSAEDKDQHGTIYADPTNNRAEVAFIITDTSSTAYSFSFTYVLK